MSRLTCHMSHVILFYNIFRDFCKDFFLDQGVELVVGGSVINGGTPLCCVVSPNIINKVDVIGVRK